MDITKGAVVELFTAPCAVGVGAPLVVQVLKVSVVHCNTLLFAPPQHTCGLLTFAAKLMKRAYDS